MRSERARDLWEVVRASAAPEGALWLQARLEELGTAPLDRAAFLAAYSGAARRLGAAAIDLRQAAVARLRDAGAEPDPWRVDEAARIALLLEASAVADEPLALGEDLFRTGESREREALLRGLILLPDPGRFVPIAVEACRTNVRTVFEAIACENPYPGRHFGEASFNQMALKAVFLDVRVARIRGLDTRWNPDLGRMARGYRSERVAAGRSVPEDLALLERGAT